MFSADEFHARLIVHGIRVDAWARIETRTDPRPEAESVNESAACAIYSNGVSAVNARTLHSACTCVCAHAYHKRPTKEGRTRPDDQGRDELRETERKRMLAERNRRAREFLPEKRGKHRKKVDLALEYEIRWSNEVDMSKVKVKIDFKEKESIYLFIYLANHGQQSPTVQENITRDTDI